MMREEWGERSKERGVRYDLHVLLIYKRYPHSSLLTPLFSLKALLTPLSYLLIK